MNRKKSLLGMAVAFALNNLFAVVICLLIMTLFGFILNTSFGWIMYVIMLVAFVFLVYHQAWHYGSRDLDNKFGNRTMTSLWGGVIATAPNVILAVFSFLIEAELYTPGFTVASQATVVAVYRFWNMPFRLIFDFFAACNVLYFLPCIAMPVITVVGYAFGYKQIKISDYIYYAREKNE